VHCAEPAPQRGWLALLCTSRLLQAMIVTAYSGVLPFMMADRHMTAAQAGSIQSAWHVGYMSSLFAVGLLADRYGPHRIFFAGSAISAMAALAFAIFARGHLSAMLRYGLAGLCAGASYTPGLQLLARNAEPAVRGRAMGLFIGSSSMGYALSLAVVAAFSHLQHWRLGLLVAAGCTVAGALLTLQALRRMRPPSAPVPGAFREGTWHARPPRCATSPRWLATGPMPSIAGSSWRCGRGCRPILWPPQARQHRGKARASRLPRWRTSSACSAASRAVRLPTGLAARG
jgi:MFS family permease